jgi:uncharacterized OsmC-like protein
MLLLSLGSCVLFVVETYYPCGGVDDEGFLVRRESKI